MGRTQSRAGTGARCKRTPRGTVLIVDRHPNMRRILSLLARLDGAKVYVAASLKGALHHLTRARIDVAVIEEEAGALEFCQQVKGDPLLWQVSVIVMAILPFPEDAEKFLVAGANACLARPLNMRDFRRELGKVLRAARVPAH